MYFIVCFVRKRNQWLIVKSKDYLPTFDSQGLQRFFAHGFDPELGWVRKANTKGQEKGESGFVEWNVNHSGARSNLKYDLLPAKISVFGDSFAFARQVEDYETWCYFLSQKLNQNVLNFGVGNYGVDQVLLRLEREFHNHPTPYVIICVVPDTISRIMSCWKHYYEYGNHFGFKPRFKLDSEQRLVLVKNFINSKEKFYKYHDYLPEIQKEDSFFKRKFMNELIRFPYIYYFSKNIVRNFKLLFETIGKQSLTTPPPSIMEINLRYREKLFSEGESTDLFKALIKYYRSLAERFGFKPYLFISPQKDDVSFINNHHHYYQKFASEVNSIVSTFDFYEELVNHERLDKYFCENSMYGGHMNKLGNLLFSDYVFKCIKADIS